MILCNHQFQSCTCERILDFPRTFSRDLKRWMASSGLFCSIGKLFFHSRSTWKCLLTIFFFFFFFLSNSKLLFFVWGNELGFEYSSIRINLPKLFHTFSFKLSSAVLRGELNLTLLFVMTLLPPTNIHPSTVFTAI